MTELAEHEVERVSGGEKKEPTTPRDALLDNVQKFLDILRGMNPRTG